MTQFSASHFVSDTFYESDYVTRKDESVHPEIILGRSCHVHRGIQIHLHK